jgi:hypothetical protein
MGFADGVGGRSVWKSAAMVTLRDAYAGERVPARFLAGSYAGSCRLKGQHIAQMMVLTTGLVCKEVLRSEGRTRCQLPTREYRKAEI